ncbi:MAG: dTDP-glucose 4,6-dehydratase [Deltaproteobacteria bacterium]|nr:dTDP-glucose 4,6-dehydratase [Deltaproteobacteria bacterium]
MSSNKRLLVTGGAGFIGSNFVRYVLTTRPNVSIVNLDLLTYAGNLRNLDGVEEQFGDRYRFVKGDIGDAALVTKLVSECDAIVHFAAESHVDRSILDASAFIETNVRGTYVLLGAALAAGGRRFIHVSTDEVYGSLADSDPAFTEETPLQANSPYSASKAASDLMVRAFVHTHGLDAVITRCSNNYGPYQFPEKLIPLMITNAVENKPLPVYGTGKNVRDWIFVTDHCAGVLKALEGGKKGEVYNFGGESERKNIDVVRAILAAMGKPDSLIRYVEDRKGHDWRYAIDCARARRELGWMPSVTFEKGIEKTVKWYLENRSWWTA